eukprot:gnl/TRDRNA2_/TRDRNA2_177835_c0_seq6.p1 gnl/TRDRNA2_/TRDRNA2_177835_c0~~gnl/TRDRNA2_/TRDRNA2_177835_c0_seq6.p1  ORF type:complete len:517 (+),score=-33.25 gnl/TRDRNA2_/TRDRNA2_177835_c0_seq6:213-1763(+)
MLFHSMESYEKIPFNFSHLPLKIDHIKYPLWIMPNNKIILETFSPLYKQAYDFMIAIADPVYRLTFFHEYKLTLNSLRSAESIGFTTHTIIQTLDRLSKIHLDTAVKSFVYKNTGNNHWIKIILQSGNFWLESESKHLFQELITDVVIKESIKDHTLRKNISPASKCNEIQSKTKRQNEFMSKFGQEKNKTYWRGNLQSIRVREDMRKIWKVQIKPNMIEFVKKRCLSGDLDKAISEEYDFLNDSSPKLGIDLKPTAFLRHYQKKSLQRLFCDGRVRSGIIVLPCGAGKTLTGISAACRIDKSVLIFCGDSLAVEQWKNQFLLWTTLRLNKINRFTSEWKDAINGETNVMITTYSMIAFSEKRTEESLHITNQITDREWGLIILDEVHMVPAQTFRTVLAIVKAHSKLGLTATPLREDNHIEDLIFLVGPQLYEANWLDLTVDGHIANVICKEIRCPMTKKFLALYDKEIKEKESTRLLAELLYATNPNKIQACRKIMSWHESEEHKDRIYLLTIV